MTALPDTLCFLDGDYLPLNQAKVSVMDRGFLFGDGVYESIPVYGGRMFRLDDHVCRNGSTRRVQLFIHTEQGARNVQCPNRAGDQVCRWEMPRINDYKSAGCIKMSPGDLAALGRHFLRYFHAGVRYSKARVVLRVVA